MAEESAIPETGVESELIDVDVEEVPQVGIVVNCKADLEAVQPACEELRELGIKLSEVKRCRWDTT